MKTYLLDILNKYKRLSENLDVKAVLCNKSWWVFNDTGEKEVYIFQEDGSLIISLSGKVTNATWKYISANKSLIIFTKDQAYMFHPAFLDEAIFALQLDGLNQFSFMIDENQTNSFAPKSLSDLKHYFEDKRKKEIEEENRKKQIRIEEETKREQILIANKKKEEEERIKQNIMNKERYFSDIIHRKTFSYAGGITFLLLFLFFTSSLILLILYLTSICTLSKTFIFFVVVPISWILICILLYILPNQMQKRSKEKKRKKFLSRPFLKYKYIPVENSYSFIFLPEGKGQVSLKDEGLIDCYYKMIGDYFYIYIDETTKYTYYIRELSNDLILVDGDKVNKYVPNKVSNNNVQAMANNSPQTVEIKNFDEFYKEHPLYSSSVYIDLAAFVAWVALIIFSNFSMPILYKCLNIESSFWATLIFGIAFISFCFILYNLIGDLRIYFIMRRVKRDYKIYLINSFLLLVEIVSDELREIIRYNLIKHH